MAHKNKRYGINMNFTGINHFVAYWKPDEFKKNKMSLVKNESDGNKSGLESKN